jgi:hypothetical protein
LKPEKAEDLKKETTWETEMYVEWRTILKWILKEQDMRV